MRGREVAKVVDLVPVEAWNLKFFPAEITVSLASWFRNLLTGPAPSPEMELGRNEPCWCGSGKKYKKCHLEKDERKRIEESYDARLQARNRMGDGIVPGKAKQRRLQRADEPPVGRR